MSKPGFAGCSGAVQLRTVQRLIDEVWNDGNYDVLPDLVADDYVGHLPIGDHYGPEGLRIDIAAYRAALPDLVATVHDLLAAGDKIVRRYTLAGTHRQPFMGLPASDVLVELHGIAIDRLADGKLIESWIQIDSFPARRDRQPA